MDRDGQKQAETERRETERATDRERERERERERDTAMETPKQRAAREKAERQKGAAIVQPRTRVKAVEEDGVENSESSSIVVRKVEDPVEVFATTVIREFLDSRNWDGAKRAFDFEL